MYVQTQHCIPPGNELNAPTGTLTLTLTNLIIIKPLVLQSVSFRMCLWGSKSPQLFTASPGGRLTAAYTIRCSRSLLMKYLMDMETVLIEAFDRRNTKRIGTMIVNFKRFHTLDSYQQSVISEFTEKFEIFASSKQKIGEATLALEISEHLPTVIPEIDTAHFIREINLREDTDRPYAPG